QGPLEVPSERRAAARLSVELEAPLQVHADVADLRSAGRVLVVVDGLHAGLVVELELDAGAEVARLGDAGLRREPHVLGDVLADHELRFGAEGAFGVRAR